MLLVFQDDFCWTVGNLYFRCVLDGPMPYLKISVYKLLSLFEMTKYFVILIINNEMAKYFVILIINKLPSLVVNFSKFINTPCRL